MGALYDSKSKTMNYRKIKQLLTKQSKIQTWLDVESALAKAQSEYGIIPVDAAKNIEACAKYENLDLEEMDRIYEKIGHGFVPFLKVFIKACDEESAKYIHYGITTQNIQQTSQLYQLKQITNIFYDILSDVLLNLSDLAFNNKDTVMAGRTHGKHAIPITYGYKVSVWISELITGIERLKESEKRIFQVMMGGAVGAFNAVGPIGKKVQDRVSELLNMNSMEVPSRNMSTHKVEYIMNLSLLASTAHKIAEEVYSTSIEECGEVMEYFKSGTIGSSTMPHKINPKLSKGIIANSQKLYSLNSMLLYSCPRPFEGDSTSYMLFDSTLQEAVELYTEILLRLEELSKSIVVNKDRMYKNACINKGIDNSEYIMMKIADKLGKDTAHSIIYNMAIKAELDKKNYFDILKGNDVINSYFTDDDIKEMLDPANYIGCSSDIAIKVSEKAKDFSYKLKNKEV